MCAPRIVVVPAVFVVFLIIIIVRMGQIDLSNKTLVMDLIFTHATWWKRLQILA